LFISIPAFFLMFVTGVVFSYWVMLPAALPFLTQFLGVTTTPRLSNYIGFVTNLMFWIGLIFETPLLMFLLTKLHIVTPKLLLKGWRIADCLGSLGSDDYSHGRPCQYGFVDGTDAWVILIKRIDVCLCAVKNWR